MLNRRQLLQSMATLPLLASCNLAVQGGSRNYTPSGLPLRRVDVSDDRVIRTIAGLRPYRSKGFNVSAERMNDKVVIHNYGHGGGGITLSWGTSHLAMELATQTQHRRCAVLGAGAAGLSAARLMQNAGWDVTIYSKDLSPNTTSNVAGGQWSPTSVYSEDSVSPAFHDQFESAMRHAYRYYQNLVGPKYGVRWISNYMVLNQPEADDSLSATYQDMYPQRMRLSPSEHPFDAEHVLHIDTMLIEPAVYLPAMMNDFQIAGGDIVIKEFRDRGEVLQLDEPVIINCTGLGSRQLFNDNDLIPIKGQLTFLLPQEEVDYIIIGNGGLYMFPRSDGILLGGTYERNQWDPTPDPEATRRIIDGHRAFFNAMEDPWA
ncbi:MAG: FAD-dependent oxidoreductase [Pseudomonadales bacterium]|nr:FAD-dependent oxidoreductase [Pseudomonadales bacterium]